MSRAFGEQLDTEDVLRARARRRPGLPRALADAGRHVGVAVASLVNLVNPERIVVGGSIGSAGEVLLEPLRDSVRRRAIPSAAQDVEIVSASLGERAELLGAVALVLQGAGSAVATVQSHHRSPRRRESRCSHEPVDAQPPRWLPEACSRS